MYKLLVILFLFFYFPFVFAAKVQCGVCGFLNNENDRYCLECTNELRALSEKDLQDIKEHQKKKVLSQYQNAVRYFNKAALQQEKKLGKINYELSLSNAQNALSFDKNYLTRQRKKELYNIINYSEVALTKIRKALKKVSTKGEKRVKLIKKGNAYYVNVLLNDKVEAKLHLDTGAWGILLSNEIAKKLSLGKVYKGHSIVADGRKVLVTCFKLKSVSLNGNKVKNVEASYYNTPGDGLLGMSYLKHFNFQIDTETDELILKTKK